MSELDRARVVAEAFVNHVKTQNFPEPLTVHSNPILNRSQYLELFDAQLLSRQLDLYARKLKETNQGYYTIGSSGHEGNAAVALAFRHTDMAFLHYRSGAFVIQRANAISEIDIVHDILLSLMAVKRDPIAGGRHKVFGSVPLNIPPQTSTIASHLPKAVGTAVSIRRAKELSVNPVMPEDAVVLCSFGDASSNHASAVSAFNAAAWIARNQYPLPLVFVCEDNGIGISVPTPQDWIASRFAGHPDIEYVPANGLDLEDTYAAAYHAQHVARHKRKPVFLHLKLVRLLGHAGSDIERQYRTQQQIEAMEFNDPLLHSARDLIALGYLQADEIIEKYQTAQQRVEQTAAQLINEKPLSSASEVMASVIPPKRTSKLPPVPEQQARMSLFKGVKTEQRNLCQSINLALMDIMLQYPNTVVFGEDVAKKGGVYRVTADLVKHFGQRRVFDSLLDETTILGHAIGLAHNGFLPIPEIQFLAYLHNAEDQLRGEAATLSFFSNGQYTNPMVVRIAGLAYQKGFGGHFHNDNSIAVLRDIPGLIIACPSNPQEAPALLRSCIDLAHQDQRVVVFLEPIALYMTRDLHEPGDNLWLADYDYTTQSLPLGEIAVHGQSDELCIVTYGNGFYLSRQAATILQKQHGISCKVIDLRWLAPINDKALLKAVKGCKHILIVDEGRKTGSLSEQLCTIFLEQMRPLAKIQRITGEDTFIPLGPAWDHVLPNKERIVAAALDLVANTADAI